MADRMAAEIFIGGPAPRRAVAELCQTIEASNVALDWGEANFEPTSEEDLCDACRDQDGVRLLHLCDDEVTWGEFPDLEAFLVKHKISFRRRSDAKYEFDARLVEYRPSTGIVLYSTDSSGKPLVPLADLLQVAAAVDRSFASKASATKQQLLGRLHGVRRAVRKSLPIVVAPFPPFEIVAEKARKQKARVR